MLNELTSLWQDITPQAQTAILDIGLALAALVGGHFLGAVVARGLRARNFDAVLRVPGSSSPNFEADRGFTPTLVAGILVRLTVWAGAAWWLAHQHGQVELADTLALVVRRTWALALVLAAALGLGSLLARRLMDCLQDFPKEKVDTAPFQIVSPASRRGAVGAVGAGAYVLAVLFVLLIAADSFDWPLTRNSALALWQLGQHLLTACAALFVGCLGARWARDLVTAEGVTSPDKRAGQYVGLAIVAGTTVLAVAVLLSSAGLLMGVAALAVLGLLLWLVRGHLPDVMAGLQLRAHKVAEVPFDGAPWQVLEVGLLTTQVGRNGEICQVQNRVVLKARMNGAPSKDGQVGQAANPPKNRQPQLSGQNLRG
jgi:hypothetical protein